MLASARALASREIREIKDMVANSLRDCRLKRVIHCIVTSVSKTKTNGSKSTHTTELFVVTMLFVITALFLLSMLSVSKARAHSARIILKWSISATGKTAHKHCLVRKIVLSY